MDFRIGYSELTKTSKKNHNSKETQKNKIKQKNIPETETNYINRYRTMPKTGNITSLKI